MIIRRRDDTRWFYLFNNIRGRFMLLTCFLEIITFVLMSMDADESSASIHKRASNNNTPQSLILPKPESFISVNELNTMEEMGGSQHNAPKDSFYKYENYEQLPDFEKEFERRMNQNKLDQDTPAMETAALNGKIGSGAQKDNYLKNAKVRRKSRAHSNVDDPDHHHHIIGTFFWDMYLLFYVYNFFATLGMIILRMFFRVGGKTSFRIFLFTVSFDLTLMILAIIGVATWEVASTVPIVVLGAIILLLNTLLPIDLWKALFGYLEYRFRDTFNIPPRLPASPPPNLPQNSPRKLSRNRPPRLPLSPPPNLPPNQPPNPTLNSTQTASGGENVDQASAGPSGIIVASQPRNLELELGNNENNDPNVDLGDVGRSSPKVRFAIENEQAGDSIVTYVPGRNSPISTISKTVILEYKNGKEKKMKKGTNAGSTEQTGSQNEFLENQAISLEELEKKDNCMKLCVQVSLDPKVGNGKPNETGERKELENYPKQKSRSFKETKNKLGQFKKCSCNNNCSHNGVIENNDLENNGNETVENFLQELV